MYQSISTSPMQLHGCIPVLHTLLPLKRPLLRFFLRFAHRLVCFLHPASFRFHLAMDTLAFGYIRPTTGRIPDLHRLETCAAGRTTKGRQPQVSSPVGCRPWLNHSYSLQSLQFLHRNQLPAVLPHPKLVSVFQRRIHSIS